MPEGPEVRTVARTLNQALMGQGLGQLWHSDFSLRKPFDRAALKALENSEIAEVSAYGKVLFIHSQKNPILVIQLGMTGQLTVEDQKKPVSAHTHVRWQLKNNNQELRYVDARRFGLFDTCDQAKKDKIIDSLGPDMFYLKTQEAPNLINKLKKSSRAIKEVLLDQNMIAGVGNIYASEALFLAQVNPQTKACEISDNSYEKLVKAIIFVLDLAYTHGGTSFSDYVDGHGVKGEHSKYLKVFQRAGLACPICKTLIKRITQGGRSTFYCPRCQPC